MSLCLSVIVPVYNSSEHLGKCIDSLLNQTLTNFELILVDDGSSDGSGTLCDEYAGRDRRIRVLHIVNNGPANARNKGLEIAQGDFVGFVDSDDWVEPEMYRALIDRAIADNADMVFCDYTAESGGKSVNVSTYGKAGLVYARGVKSNPILPYFFGYDTSEIGHYKQCCPFADYSSYVWLCVYRLKMLKSNEILFPSERIYYNEDNLFNLFAVFYADRISHLDRTFYHYRLYDTSLTKKFNDKYFEMKINKFRFLSDFLSSHGMSETWQNRLSLKICIESAGIINYYVNVKSLPFVRRIALINTIITSDMISEALDDTDTHTLPFSGLKLFLIFAKKKSSFILFCMSRLYQFMSSMKKLSRR
jgi:glycosyltransferase involved in cell wall biosynthesis